jgi:hypothetical protein
MENGDMRKAIKQFGWNILVGMLLAAVVSAVIVSREPQPAEVVFEPQVYYSDWLSDMTPLEDWLDISGTYEGIVTWLKRIFEREGVPGELVWLAAVESEFNPVAVSSRGAVGLFQIMPETAQRYGVRIRNPDERLQPVRNAQVAARYLADLHRRFGDWTLVLAAFNAGESRVARLTKSRGMDYEAIATALPAETRSYVPRVRAMIAHHESRSLAEIRDPFLRYAGVLLFADSVEP